jgi:hypothetical protein
MTDINSRVKSTFDNDIITVMRRKRRKASGRLQAGIY